MVWAWSRARSGARECVLHLLDGEWREATFFLPGQAFNHRKIYLTVMCRKELFSTALDKVIKRVNNVAIAVLNVRYRRDGTRLRPSSKVPRAFYSRHLSYDCIKMLSFGSSNSVIKSPPIVKVIGLAQSSQSRLTLLIPPWLRVA